MPKFLPTMFSTYFDLKNYQEGRGGGGGGEGREGEGGRNDATRPGVMGQDLKWFKCSTHFKFGKTE